MIEKMIATVKQLLPLRISEGLWDGTVLQIIGPSWSFTTLSAWRISTKNKLVFGCYDDNSTQLINSLKGNNIIDIFCQTDFLKIDPVFYLSSGQYIEIFSSDTFEPWTLNINGIGIFVPTPSEPHAFESSLNDL